MSSSKRFSPIVKTTDDDLRSQSLLKNPLLEVCKFTDPEIRSLFLHFPAQAEFRSFDALALSDSMSRTWVCFPALPFQLGYSYPFPTLTKSFFSKTGISYAQAMPMLWRTLYTIEEILKSEKIEFGLPELSFLYNLVTHGSNRFIFKSKPRRPIPVYKTTQNDTLWKNQFFFVRRDTIPDGKSLPLRWVTKVEGFSKFAEGEGVEERAEAFLKLDPIVRTFKPRILGPIEEEEGENQEISATYSPTMSSAQRSESKSACKSVSKFAMEDLDSIISLKSEKMDVSKTPVPKAGRMNTRAKSATAKRKKPSDEDWFAKEKLVHELLSEVMESIRDEHENVVKELQQTLTELRTTIAAKDKAMTKMKKDYEEQLAVTKAQADDTVLVATEEAKTSALKSMLQARIKVVEQALDPAFDKSSWDVTKWKNALADLNDGEEETAPEKMDVTGPSEAAGANVEVGSLEVGDKPVGDEGCIEKA